MLCRRTELRGEREPIGLQRLRLTSKSQFLDSFVAANLESKGDDELMVVVVDDLGNKYTEASKQPMKATSSPFSNKSAEDCFEILQKLVDQTGSQINPECFAIFDERSPKDKSVLMVQGSVDGGKVQTVRVAMEQVDMLLANLMVGGSSIGELRQEGEKAKDGIMGR